MTIATQQIVGNTRVAQRTDGAILNANFAEIFGRRQYANVMAATANFSFVVPAGYKLESFDIINNTANAVTGGINVGTTAAGSDVVSAQAVGANAIVTPTGATILKRIFSKTAPQTLYVTAATAWNSASVDFIIILQKIV